MHADGHAASQHQRLVRRLPLDGKQVPWGKHGAKAIGCRTALQACTERAPRGARFTLGIRFRGFHHLLAFLSLSHGSA